MTTIAKTSHTTTTTTISTPATDTGATTKAKPGDGALVTCMGPSDDFKAKGPSGVIQHGDTTYKVTNGDVSLNGQKIGSIDDVGNYSVRFSRQPNAVATGNIKDLIGATYEGTLSTGKAVTNQVNGSVQVGTERFHVHNGRVSDQNGKRIGTMDGEGRFRVQRDGQTVEGSLDQVHGATYSGRNADGKSVSNRPSGTVEVGGATYDVKNGKVFQDGKMVGSVNDRGQFAITGSDGKAVTGTVQDLPGARWKTVDDKGATTNQSHADGTVRIGTSTYFVDNGKVSQNGRVIGTVENDGSFKVNVNGQRYEGNLSQLHGAVVLGKRNDGSRIDTGPSGSVRVNGQSYTVREGQVFLGNSRRSIGTVNERGDFDVRLNGQDVRGNLGTTPGATWTRTE